MCRAALVMMLVVGCGGGSTSVQHPDNTSGPTGTSVVADPIPTSPGPDCAVVADKLATVAHAETPDRQAEARATLRTRCTNDKWSDEARSCFATVENDSEIEGCASKLSAAQQQALHAEHKTPRRDDADTVVPKTEDAPHGGTRGPTTRDKRESSDPCEGGE